MLRSDLTCPLRLTMRFQLKDRGIHCFIIDQNRLYLFVFRYDYIVKIPLPSHIVDQLSEDLKQFWADDKHLISIHPVLFNVGMESDSQLVTDFFNAVNIYLFLLFSCIFRFVT